MKLGARGLRQVYQGRAVLDLDGIEFEPGSLNIVLGANGAGKTTLLRLLALLDRPNAGEILIDGLPAPLVGAGRAALRRRLTAVFTEPFFFFGSALRNVGYGLRVRGAPRARRRERALAGLERVGLAGLAAQSAATLSSGEKQRAALARALVLEPEALLLDEPFANLDQENGRLIRELIPGLADGRRTVILVTHDHDYARSLNARCFTLREGRLAR